MKGIFLLLTLFLPGILSGQTTGTMMGTISDQASGLPIPLATVSFKAGTTTLGAISDEKGQYVVREVPFGNYNVMFKALGFQGLVKSDVSVSSGSITYVDAQIIIKEGTGVEIIYEKWRDSVIRKGLPPLLLPIDPQMLTKSAGGRSPGELLEVFVPRVTRNASGNLNFSGSRSGSTLYLVDGIKVLGEEPQIPNQGIGEMAVYIGGIPAQYGDTTSGVVIINTKSYSY